jgi:hypothetical protein
MPDTLHGGRHDLSDRETRFAVRFFANMRFFANRSTNKPPNRLRHLLAINPFHENAGDYKQSG